jgi:hypothetical protein
MRRGKFVWLIAISLIVVAIAWIYGRRLTASVPANMLTVSSVGYTNLPDGNRAAMFVISNQWNATMMRWGEAFIERAPFAQIDDVSRWKRANDIVGGRYLKPGETGMVIVRGPFPDQGWRLRLHWSPGVRARVSLATRKHSMWPDFLRVPPGYWASSDSVPP